jgi:hypothetical protein
MRLAPSASNAVDPDDLVLRVVIVDEIVPESVTCSNDIVHRVGEPLEGRRFEVEISDGSAGSGGLQVESHDDIVAGVSTERDSHNVSDGAVCKVCKARGMKRLALGCCRIIFAA